MKRFKYSAFSSSGSRSTDEIDALSREAAFSALQRMGLTPISLEELGAARQGETAPRPAKRFFDDPQLIVRTIRMLAILIGRQVPVPDALNLAADVETSRYGTKLLKRMSKSVAEGRSMSAAMAEAEGFASPYILSMIAAGEKTATLGTVLERVADQLEKDLELKRKIKGALAYPIVLILASLGMLVFIALYMVPALMPLLEQSANGVPGIILFLNGLAELLNENGFTVLAALLALCGAVFLLPKHPAFRRIMEEVWFRVPLLGKMLASSETIRFSASLGLMLSNHVDLVRALDISRHVVNTGYFKAAIGSASPALQEGQSLDKAFAGFERLPKSFIALARAGSETRALPAALKQIADVERAILEKQIELAVKMLPPVLTLLVGGFVGLFVLVIVDTIMSLNDAIF